MKGITIKLPEETLRRLKDEAASTRRSVAAMTLMRRWPRMDPADASIVVMSERHSRCQVLTVDRTDFAVYRRNDRQIIDFIAPEPS